MGGVVVGQKQKSKEGEKRGKERVSGGDRGKREEREDGDRGEWGRREEERQEGALASSLQTTSSPPQPSTRTSGNQATSDPSVKTQT